MIRNWHIKWPCLIYNDKSITKPLLNKTKKKNVGKQCLTDFNQLKKVIQRQTKFLKMVHHYLH